jgi:hypothetical protein
VLDVGQLSGVQFFRPAAAAVFRRPDGVGNHHVDVLALLAQDRVALFRRGEIDLVDGNAMLVLEHLDHLG